MIQGIARGRRRVALDILFFDFRSGVPAYVPRNYTAVDSQHTLEQLDSQMLNQKDAINRALSSQARSMQLAVAL